MASIGICLACYNRRDITLKCLENLDRLTVPEGFEIAVYLLDDASPDGTAQAVRERFPAVTVLEGNGHLFWGGGMRAAFQAAMDARHDFYLWLNDDAELFPDLLQRLIDTYEKVSEDGKRLVLVCGSCLDPITGQTSYGGRRHFKSNPLCFPLVVPDATSPTGCETMNGNVALIPDALARNLGNIDLNFRHQMGDYDYGLRARRACARLWVCPGYVAACSPNPARQGWRNGSLTLIQRWTIANSPFGLPFREWMRFVIRHGGIRGAILGLASYRHVFFPDRRYQDLSAGAPDGAIGRTHPFVSRNNDADTTGRKHLFSSIT